VKAQTRSDHFGTIFLSVRWIYIGWRDIIPAISYKPQGGNVVLRYALTFFIIALIAAFLGFGGIAGAASSIAQILFYVFVLVFVVTLVTHLVRGKKV
jgi:uncharacterized membrane protein YtjA (UPF0391 family)